MRRCECFDRNDADVISRCMLEMGHDGPHAFEPFQRVSGVATPEPPPVHVPGGASMHDLVCADLQERKAFGLRKYGTLLQMGNGRNHLMDGLQEVYDLAVYLKQATLERAEHLARIAHLEAALRRIQRAQMDTPHLGAGECSDVADSALRGEPMHAAYVSRPTCDELICDEHGFPTTIDGAHRRCGLQAGHSGPHVWTRS